MPTIAEAIREGARRLQSIGADQQRRTAGALLQHTLGIDRTHLLVNSNEQVAEAQYQAYLSLIDRRAAGEPLQYITGHQEFYGLDFIVNPSVLIPRPETEFLVEQAIKLAQTAPLIVDAGAGSGCIAVALAVNLANAKIIAIDISGAALEVAQQNANRNGVKDRIEFVEGDLLEPLAHLRLENAVDLIVSNPPYVEQRNAELVQREVREWEPHSALFGGADGLDFYRRLLADGLSYVKPGGYLVCEIGYNQFDAISDFANALNWELIDTVQDLQSIPRIITARRMSEKP